LNKNKNRTRIFSCAVIFYSAAALFFFLSIMSIERGSITPIIPIIIAIIPVVLSSKFAPSVTVFLTPSTISSDVVSRGHIA